MSMIDAEDRQLIADSVNKFIADNYAFDKREARHEEGHKFGKHWHDFAELGWLMLTTSADSGGMGGGIIDAQVLLQGFGRGLISEPFTEAGLLAPKVLELATAPERREEALAPFMTGEQTLILAHCETSGIQDASALQTTASLGANGYTIKGTKRVVYQAGCADIFLVSTVLDEQTTLFLVPAHSEGLVISEYSTIDNRFAADLTFNNVQLPSSTLIVSGTHAATAIKEGELFVMAAQLGELEGIATSLRIMTKEYLYTREQFGTKIANFQALQHMLADMVIAEEEIKALAWMVSEADLLEDANEREVAIRTATARATMAAKNLAEIAVQLHGGIGVTDELIIGHYLRRIVALDAMFGDSQQQLLWLASRY